MLLLPGDTYATRRQGPVLQQLEHATEGDVSVNDCFRPVARFFDRITRPEQLLTALPEAMRVLTSPAETGAVVIALPQDIQTEAYDFPAAFFEPRDWPIYRAAPHPDQIAAVAELIAAAEQPLIIAGGGVLYSQAEGELAALAEQLGIPVVETFAGKGAVQQDVWWGMGGVGLEGNPAANALAKAADLVIHVGTRLTDFTTGSQSVFEHPDVRFASINVVDRDARKQGATPVLADAKLALAALRAATQDVAPREAWGERARSEKQAWLPVRAAALAPRPATPISQAELIGALNESARPGDTIIAAAGGPPGDLQKVWDATGERHCHLEFGFSCMGYELPATLGVRLAQARRRGDRADRRRHVPDAADRAGDRRAGRPEGHRRGLRQPRLPGHPPPADARHAAGTSATRCATASARSERDRSRATTCGSTSPRSRAGSARTVFAAGTRDEVLDALARARETDGPVVIVVPTAPHENLPASGVWWDVAPAAVSSQPWLEEKREAYQAGPRDPAVARMTLRDRLRAGEPTLGTFLNLGSPLAAEACALAGFDWLLIDLEHGAGEDALVGQLLAAAAHGVPALVRVESAERIRAGRALDAGAAGVMFPRMDIDRAGAGRAGPPPLSARGRPRRRDLQPRLRLRAPDRRAGHAPTTRSSA